MTGTGPAGFFRPRPPGAGRCRAPAPPPLHSQQDLTR